MNIFDKPLQPKSNLIKTDLKTKLEFLQPIDKAFYIKEKENKYFLTDGKEFTHKLSAKTALDWLGL
jgi:hypothetical protein